MDGGRQIPKWRLPSPLYRKKDQSITRNKAATGKKSKSLKEKE